MNIIIILMIIISGLCIGTGGIILILRDWLVRKALENQPVTSEDVDKLKRISKIIRLSLIPTIVILFLILIGCAIAWVINDYYNAILTSTWFLVLGIWILQFSSYSYTKGLFKASTDKIHK